MILKDCFAFRKGQCQALNRTYCDTKKIYDCAFYKPKGEEDAETEEMIIKTAEARTKK